LALGAQMRDVYALVLKQGMHLIRIGVALGLVGAFFMARVLSRILFGITATDPLTFLLVAVILTAAALIACWIPARRAAKVEPLAAIRHE
jgi:ABC-type antimicrobial peptide transport system permease subunit